MTRTFPSGGISLHHRWLTHGDAGAPPLVLLHGFTGDSRSWEDFAAGWEDLAAEGDLKGARLPGLLAIDLIGHGRSPVPDEPALYRSQASTNQILATVTCLGLPRFHLLGYSMGGRLALSAALLAPELVATVSVIGASPGLADPLDRQARETADRTLAARLLEEGLAAFVERWMAQPLFASQARLGPERLALERARRMEQSKEGLAMTLQEMGTGAMMPLWDRLGGLKPPLLYLAGAEDPKFIALGEAVAARVPRARLEIVPKAGHAAQLEAPAQVARRVMAFVLASGSTDPTQESSP